MIALLRTASRGHRVNFTLISILRTTDLKPDERVTVEKLLGHPLHEDEAVALSAFRPHPAPAGEAKRQAASELHEILGRRAEKVRDIPRLACG